MNRTFKRALSSILAFVMVMSCMIVMNVSTALASDYTDHGSMKVTSPTTKEFEFTSISEDPNISLNENDSVFGIVKKSGTVKIRQGMVSVNGAVIDIPVPENSVGTISLTNQSNTTDRLMASEEDNEAKVMTKSPAVDFPFTSKSSSDGYVTFTSTKEVKLTNIKIVLTSGNFDVGTTYTLTGKTNLNSTNISVGGISTTTDESGNYTIEKQVESGAEAPFKAGNTIAITADDYDTQEATISAGSDNTHFTASEVTLTKYVLTPLKNGEYKGSYVLPNFEEGEGVDASGGKFKGDIKFMLDEAKHVEFVAKCGSSDGSKTATFTLKDSAETSIIEGEPINGGASEVTYKADLKAGTYTINAAETGGTTLQLVSVNVADITGTLETIGEDNYIVFGVSEDFKNSFNSFDVVRTTGETVEASNNTTVYSGVKFNDSTTKMAANYNTDYVVAFKVAGAEVQAEGLAAKYKVVFK